ncbi:hypothetical protein V8E52_009637 [Russula decolorans]
MASRITLNTLPAFALPVRARRPHAAVPQILSSRTIAALSSSNAPPRAELAVESIDNLPSYPSLITKTGTAILDYDLATAIAKMTRITRATSNSHSSHARQSSSHAMHSSYHRDTSYI